MIDRKGLASCESADCANQAPAPAYDLTPPPVVGRGLEIEPYRSSPEPDFRGRLSALPVPMLHNGERLELFTPGCRAIPPVFTPGPVVWTRPRGDYGYRQPVTRATWWKNRTWLVVFALELVCWSPPVASGGSLGEPLAVIR